MVDESPPIAVTFELGTDPVGLWWTIIPRHGIQKVGGEGAASYR